MKLWPKRRPRPAVVDGTVERVIAAAGGKCRVAPFLPDLPCAGEMDVYDPMYPAGMLGDESRFLAVCSYHLQWIADHQMEAYGLGLVHQRAKPDQ